ncbi:hypothetical protein KSP39_PZI018759 [Platanthera zijinensis]|uniref:Uncharacterized protein n=1 Tax=Platanthera zijinensis TaxID=2320716 RepID=A0AAP0FYH5_9ASPA
MEESKVHSQSAAVAGVFSAGHRMAAAMSILLILFTILSFSKLQDQSSLWYLPLASAYIVAGAFLVLKRTRFALFRFRFGRNLTGRWFTGDDEGDVENPKDENAVVRVGVEVYSSGNVYQGEFLEGRCSGSGICTFFLEQGNYAGDWLYGKYDGYGIERWENDSMYEGRYKWGLRHGFGVHNKLDSGDRYAGEWKMGRYHGRGVLHFSDGHCFAGEFQGGVKHGLGGGHFRGGHTYGGQYFDDQIHGFGVYHFANGQCYEGSWHKGKRHGFGSYTLKDGEALSGEWDSGTLKNYLPLADSNVDRAVQCARKAWMEWLHAPRIEEQANKAVEEAYRAASAAQKASVKAVQSRLDHERDSLDSNSKNFRVNGLGRHDRDLGRGPDLGPLLAPQLASWA